MTPRRRLAAAAGVVAALATIAWPAGGPAGARGTDDPGVDEDTTLEEFVEDLAADADGDLVDPHKNTRDGHPFDDLPAHVELVVDVGARPDWSPDGTQLLYLVGAPLGSVWTVHLDTGERNELTGHLAGPGFTRAQFLANGDVLLCAPASGPLPTPERPEAGRFTAVMSVLRAPFDGEPQQLGIPCWEGMVASQDDLRIAWNRSDVDYTATNLAERVLFGVSEIWTGELRLLDDGTYVIVDVEMVVDRDAVSPVAVLEVENFRPTDGDELLFTAYAFEGGQLMGVDIATGEVTDYSQDPLFVEGAGVAADGSFALVERDLESAGVPTELDVWWLSLDGEARWERLTYLNAYRDRNYYASNPAVSPDGQRFAFQLSINEDVEGEGDGILVYDLTAVDLPHPLAGPGGPATDDGGRPDGSDEATVRRRREPPVGCWCWSAVRRCSSASASAPPPVGVQQHASRIARAPVGRRDRTGPPENVRWTGCTP